MKKIASLLILLCSMPANAGSFECLIVPNQVVELRSPSEGLIEKITVRRGDPIKKDQVLVTLESSVEQAAVDLAKYRTTLEGRMGVAKARVEYAEAKLKRSATLAEQNYVTAQANDEVETELKIAKAELQDAKENLELAKYEYRHANTLMNRRVLRSPFDGVVTDRMLNPGDMAEVGNSRKGILKLAQIDPLKVEVSLPQQAHGKIHPGTIAQVIPEGDRGKYNATVTLVDSVVDAASGTLGARLELKGAAGKVPAGLRCRIEISGVEGGKGR